MKMTNFSTIREHFHRNAGFRNQALPVIILVAFYILIIPGFLCKQSAEKDLARLKGRYREFSVLAGEYQSLSERVCLLEKKRVLTEAKGIAQVMGEISQSLGMKEKLKSIRETGTRKTLERMSEETAEVQFEKVNMTEMLYLLYKVENAPMILTVRKMAIRKSFENPELLDITMSLSLFTG